LEEYAQAVQAQEQAFQQQVQLNQALIGDVAQLTAIDQQLAAYADVNWQQLSDNDFVEAQKLFFTYNQLQTQRANLAQQFEAKQNQLMQTHQQSLARRVQEGQTVLAKEIPNWSRETSQAIISTGKDMVFPITSFQQLLIRVTLKFCMMLCNGANCNRTLKQRTKSPQLNQWLSLEQKIQNNLPAVR